MKKVRFTLLMLLIAAMTTTITSCDDDPWRWDYYNYYEDWYDNYDWYNDSFDYGTDELNEMAQTLRGHWTGTLRNYYYDNDGQWTYADMNVELEFDQYDSKSLNGRGKETDWVGNESQELRFSWYIDPRSGDINIRYDNSNYTFVLDAKGNSETSGFYLDSNSFSGVMEGQNNDELIVFDCSRTTLAKPHMSLDADNSEAVASDSSSTKVYGSASIRSVSLNSPRLHTR